MHPCVWLYVCVRWGEREHKGDSNSSGCILQSAFVKKEKLFQRLHPLFFLMSNISTLWKSNKLSCYVLFLWPLHWISTWFTWLFKDQQKTPPCNVGCGNMFLQRSYKGFKKCWLQSADVIGGCGCKMCIHRWCGQLIVLLISYWEQSASLGHPPLGSLRGVARPLQYSRKLDQSLVRGKCW